MPIELRKRIGPKERRLVMALINRIRRYRIFRSMRRQRETRFNMHLMNHLRQEPRPLDVNNADIPTTEFFGEQFRPEFYLMSEGRAICAVECKLLRDRSAKARWKEGLSQALLYTAMYKAVILVLFDFTSDSKYAREFGPGKREATRFKRKLREKFNIHIIVRKPEEN